MNEEFGALTRRLVYPTSPVLLTKNGPLKLHSILEPVFLSETRKANRWLDDQRLHTHLKFENRFRMFHSKDL